MLDALDVALLAALRDSPRAGQLELSRLLRVSRATVQARLERLESAGVVTGYGPDVELAAAGYPVLAFVTLEIAQGRLTEVTDAMAAIPAVVEAYATTGPGDVHCRVAAASHEDLQRALLQVSQIPGVARAASGVALSRLIAHRPVALLEAADVPPAPRAGPKT